MKLEKRDVGKKEPEKDLPKNTFTPKQVQMVLTGLTKELVTSSEEMFISLNDYGYLVIQAVKSGRSSRYNCHEVYAMRDCCIIINGMCNNTTNTYLPTNDSIYMILKSMRPTGKNFIELKELLQEHLAKMLFELRIVSGGFGISKMEGYDEHGFGPVKDCVNG